MTDPTAPRPRTLRDKVILAAAEATAENGEAEAARETVAGAVYYLSAWYGLDWKPKPKKAETKARARELRDAILGATMEPADPRRRPGGRK